MYVDRYDGIPTTVGTYQGPKVCKSIIPGVPGVCTYGCPSFKAHVPGAPSSGSTRVLVPGYPGRKSTVLHMMLMHNAFHYPCNTCNSRTSLSSNKSHTVTGIVIVLILLLVLAMLKGVFRKGPWPRREPGFLPVSESKS
jgi:hypothetical protein